MVVVVDAKPKSGAQDCSMVLEKVTRAHWEVDRSGFEEDDSSWRGGLDDAQLDGDVDVHRQMHRKL